jgi:hypothetical protein
MRGDKKMTEEILKMTILSRDAIKSIIKDRLCEGKSTATLFELRGCILKAVKEEIELILYGLISSGWLKVEGVHTYHPDADPELMLTLNRRTNYD